VDKIIVFKNLMAIRFDWSSNGVLRVDEACKALIFIGAGDRDRTGDIQLGKLTFCH
jgi:hypothetical protein